MKLRLSILVSFLLICHPTWALQGIGGKASVGGKSGFGGGASGGGGGGATFSYVAGSNGTNSAFSVTTITTTLGHTPTTGQIVLCTIGFNTSGNPTALAVKDSNANTYTIGANSPATNASASLSVSDFRLLSAPANATSSIVATWTGGTVPFVWLSCDIFIDSGSTQVFDQDTVTTNATTSGTNVNLPSLTPAVSGELLYCGVTPNNSITAPTAGSTLGVFTGAVIDGNGSAAEYALSRSSVTTANFTDSSSGDTYSAVCQAVKP